MSIFRSEEMKHLSIRIPKDSASEIMRVLGNLDYSIEFVDLTKDDIEAKKNYGQLIHRCDEVLKKIQDFNNISSDFGQTQNKYDKYLDFKNDIEKDIKNRDKKSGSYYFDLVENEIFENDKRIKELVESHTNIREDLLNLIEKKYVFSKTRDLIINNEINPNIANNENLNENFIQTINNLNFMAGTINIGDELKMKRMIFRVSRGRALTTFYDFEMNKNEYLYCLPIKNRGMKIEENNIFSNNMFDYGSVIKKKIFNIMFPGGEENILLNKILKVCEIFQASRFNIPRNSEINYELGKLENDVSDKKNLLQNIEKNINDIIVGSSSFDNKPNIKYNMYKLYYLQEKLIYSTLNKCKLLGNFLDGEVWIPTKKLPEVHNVLNNIGKKSENFAPATLIELPFDENVVPPTFIPTNEFFASFQEVVDTFGIPHYREINPGLFTVITFPFLFGIMFGDIAHGSLLLIVAIYLCWYKKSIEKSKNMFKSALPYRYFLLFMGISATYCGWCYNDFLSFPINFGTCYEQFYPIDQKDSTNVLRFTVDNIYENFDEKYTEYDVYKKENCVYKFGVDPIWMSASNELTFINSLKMKISVIFGVLQMLLGIFLKGLNALFSKDYTEFIFVFIPQFILMTILFGYMDLLIFIKWCTNYDPFNFVTMHDKSEDISPNSPFWNNNINTTKASDIKTVLMNIFLKFGKIPDDDWPLWKTKDKMKNTHIIILITSIICMILMIFPKVFIKFSQLNKKYLAKNQINNNIEEQEHMIPKNEMSKPSLSDIFVNQIIESIEFILGTVSNTASYLRLWALSLAHSQLSKVFFERTLGYGLKASGSVIINGILAGLSFVGFAVITLGILMFMDCLECFLHTLRLHWVEFQNKFYRADGYSFSPYSFTQIIKENEID